MHDYDASTCPECHAAKQNGGKQHKLPVTVWLPHNIPFPKATTEDYLIQAAQDIVTLLKQKATIPLPHHPNNTLNDAITSTATLLQRAATIPPPQAPIKNPVPPLQNISKNVNKPTPAPHEPSPRVSPAPNVIPDVPPSPRVLPH